jgi:hypothetical protein
MDEQALLSLVDTAVFVMANLVNLGMIGIFLARPQGWRRLERVIGLLMIVLVLPLALVVGFNAVTGREWWFVVLPLLLAVFLLVELVLDYILKRNFRQTRLLGPYLLLYYAALMGMVGYTFLTRELYGIITLVTYFLQLGATWYSYRQVGHGKTPASMASS